MIPHLYQENLMDHYHHPRNRGTLAQADFSGGSYNPSCGDAIAMQGKIGNGHLSRVMFEGKGCVISQAVASMLTEQVQGKALTEIVAYDVHFIRSLVGMQLGPTRLKCALLPLEALQEGIKKYVC
jgi:nitrogen fixation NifU-like protein